MTVINGLKDRGFEVWKTGGGCSCWGKIISDDFFVMISDDASHDISEGAIVVVLDRKGNADPINSWIVNHDQVLKYADIASSWVK